MLSLKGGKEEVMKKILCQIKLYNCNRPTMHRSRGTSKYAEGFKAICLCSSLKWQSVIFSKSFYRIYIDSFLRGKIQPSKSFVKH